MRRAVVNLFALMLVLGLEIALCLARRERQAARSAS